MNLRIGPNGPTVLRLEPAFTLWARTRGLLGRSGLPTATGLWIRPCNSVHTFFMKFALDVIFLDKDQVVVKIVRDLRPGRVTRPVWRARSVIELAAGTSRTLPLHPGTKVYVDHSLS